MNKDSFVEKKLAEMSKELDLKKHGPNSIGHIRLRAALEATLEEGARRERERIIKRLKVAQGKTDYYRGAIEALTT